MKIVYNEIGVLNDNSNTHERIVENEGDILHNQIHFLKFVNVDVKAENITLPFIYWIPNFHQNPVKARLIVSSSVCITKQVATYISKSLKLITQRRKRYCHVIEEFTHKEMVDN